MVIGANSKKGSPERPKDKKYTETLNLKDVKFLKGIINPEHDSRVSQIEQVDHWMLQNNKVGDVEEARQYGHRGQAPGHYDEARSPLHRSREHDERSEQVPEDPTTEKEGGKANQVPLDQVPILKKLGFW